MKFLVEIIEVRRCVEDACHNLIADKDIADKIYRSIIYPLEDYIFDECERMEDK